MSLGDFLTDSGEWYPQTLISSPVNGQRADTNAGFGGGSWADEVEETVVTGTRTTLPQRSRETR